MLFQPASAPEMENAPIAVKLPRVVEGDQVTHLCYEVA
jgi:hypothetical protein